MKFPMSNFQFLTNLLIAKNLKLGIGICEFGAGFEQNTHFRITHQSSEVQPVRNFGSRDFGPTDLDESKDSTPSRSIAVLGISNRSNRSFILMEPKAKDYASECKELVWF